MESLEPGTERQLRRERREQLSTRVLEGSSHASPAVQQTEPAISQSPATATPSDSSPDSPQTAHSSLSFASIQSRLSELEQLVEQELAPVPVPAPAVVPLPQPVAAPVLVDSEDDMSDPVLSAASAVKWDGITHGAPFAKAQAAMQLADTLAAAKATNNQPPTTQYRAMKRLPILAAMIPVDTPGRALIAAFQKAYGYYLTRAQHNQYPSLSEARRLGVQLLCTAIPAATQAAAATAALDLRLQHQYRGLHRAAQAARAIAPTEAEFDQALADNETAVEAVLALGPAPQQMLGETAAEHQLRQQQHAAELAAAQQQQQATQQALDAITAPTVMLSFPSVEGIEVSPSDAIMVLFWIIMDLVFNLGDVQRIKEFYNLQQGSDTVAAFGQRFTTVFNTIAHMAEEGAKRPEAVFTDALNSDKLRAALQQWTQQQLGSTSDPATRLQLTIRYATQQEDMLQSDEKLRLQKQSYTGDSSSSTTEQQYQDVTDTSTRAVTKNRQGHVTHIYGISIPRASAIKVNGVSPWTQQQQDDTISNSRPQGLRSICSALNVSKVKPEDPNAMCIKHGFCPRHTNAACRLSHSTGMAAQQQSATARTSSSGSSEVNPMEFRQMQLALQQLQAQQLAAAAGQQPTSSHGVPKPPRNDRNGGDRNPCPICNYSRGHTNCYYARPDLIRGEWEPSKAAPMSAIQLYLEKCAQMNVTPQLGRVEYIVQGLARDGKLPAAVLQMPQVKRLLQPVAAVGYYGPPPTAFTDMGFWGNNNWQAAAGSVAPSWAGNSQPGAPPSTSSGSQAAGPSAPPFSPQGAAAQQQPSPGMFGMTGTFGMTGMTGILPFPTAALAVDGPDSKADETAVTDEPESFTIEEVRSSSPATYKQWRAALAATRQRASRPVSFLPPASVPADPNTASGGRAHPSNTEAANMDLNSTVLSSMASLVTATASMINPTAAQKLRQAANLVQQAMLRSDKQQKTQVTAQFFQQLTEIVPSLQQSALMLIMGQPALAEDAAPELLAAAARAAAEGIASSSTAEQQQRQLAAPTLLFEPKVIDYQRHLQGYQVLDKFSSSNPDLGLYIGTSDGRMHAVSNTVSDSGANLLLITEAQCKRMGCNIITGETPALKAIDGQLHSFIIGHTPPVDLTIGRGTPSPLHKRVERMWVIAGDAGGMYDVLLDKETFKAWFAHVSPVYQHFIWFPKASQLDFSVIAGVPIASSISRQAALLAMQQHPAVGVNVGAVAQHPSCSGSAAEHPAHTSAAAAAAAAPTAKTDPVHLMTEMLKYCLGIPAAATATFRGRCW